MADTVDALLASLNLEDDTGSPVVVNSFADLDAARLAVYAAVDPSVGMGAPGTRTLAVQCTADGQPWEHIVVVRGEPGALTGEAVIMSCKITLSEFPPSMLVEYTFDADGGAGEGARWMLAPACQDALAHYRASKFASWRKMLDKPDCLAALKRMLQIGMITTLFDNQLLATPEEDKGQYEVTDDKGKTVTVPHPVTGLRVWNCATGAYDAISPHLDGAPETPEDQAKAWSDIVSDLKTKLGEEALNDLMK